MLLKIKLIKQDNAGHLFYFFNKQNKNKKTHTHTHKWQKKENEMKLLAPAPFPFHFERSINQSYDQWDAISLITYVCLN